MVAQRNIINKVKIRVNTPSQQNGLLLKDKLDVFFKKNIFPEIDAYFNSIQRNHSKTIRIQNILIEINVDKKVSLPDMKVLIMNEIKTKINETNFTKNNSANFQIITSEQKEIEAFFFFLKNGSFPWWFEETAQFWDEFTKKIHFGKGNSEKLISLLSFAEIRKRLIFQFEDEQVFNIVSSLSNLEKKSSIKLNLPKIYRIQFWETLLHFSLFNNKQKAVEILQNIPFNNVKKILKEAGEKFEIHIPINSADFIKIDDRKKEFQKAESPEKMDSWDISENDFNNKKEEVFIKNAGLILLHPFLKMFFEKLDFLSGKNIKPGKIDEAIHVLHYLATGKEQAYEHELTIEKFICNVPFQQPIDRHISLTKEQKIACEVLLLAVLENWSTLKSKSTEIIQNEFLQRDGKLIITDEKQTLIVQRKTLDILLDKLPWNLHLIKIPWKEMILFVEW